MTSTSPRSLLALSALVGVIAGPAALADEREDRKTYQSMVQQTFQQSVWKSMELIAEGARKRQHRTGSGIWKLGLYYGAINGLTDRNFKSPNLWDALEADTKAWKKAFPDSPTPYIARATVLSDRAWTSRGPWRAGEVSDEQWKEFRRWLAAARKVLESGKKIAARDPQWYALMANVALGQGWPDEKFDALLEEAIAREPYYYETYFIAAKRALPKWGGSPEKIERVARRAVEATREKDGEGVYARIYWVVMFDGYFGKLFQGTDVDWPTMSRGIDDVLRQYPDAYNLNHFAAFSCFARDRAKTRSLLDQIGDRADTRSWCSGQQYEECRAWAFASEEDVASRKIAEPEVETARCE